MGASRPAPRTALLTTLCRLIALGAAGVVTWITLGGAAADRPALPLLLGAWPSTATRVGLLLTALAAVAVTGALIARHPPPGVPAPAAVGPLAAAALLVAAELRGHPVDAVLGLATTALVLLDVLPRSPVRPAGLALGVAVALHPVLILFATVLPGPGPGSGSGSGPAPGPGPRRRRVAAAPALTALAVAVVLHTVVRFADPARAVRFWHGFDDPAATGDPANLTVLGVLLRLGLHGPPLLCVRLAVVVTAAVLAVRRARAFGRDGQPLLAAGVLGCATLAAAPVAGPGDLGWLLLAATGRLGRRPEDRALWPVIAVTITFVPSTMLDPGIEPVSGLLLRKAPTLVALAAAAALPFRSRSDPLWHLPRAPGPPPHHRPVLRGIPLLPAPLRPVSRPNLVLELLLIQVGYGIYTYIRNAAPDRVAAATAHARSLYRLEQTLRIDIEPAVNGWALRAGDWLLDAAQQYYKVLHIAMPLGVLVWLYTWHPARYRTARTILFAATGLALLGFWGYPLAPPRLVPGLGLREDRSGTPGEAPLGVLTALSNQYAAMPSLHIAWAVWCALVVMTTARHRRLRPLAALYPALTFVVVVATANHWVLDAVGGVAVLLAGCLTQYLLTARLLTDPVPPAAPAQAPLGALTAQERRAPRE
ncbi:phosphatase PAP2 family protein [Kitasatospora sp. NPDC047058]|uniref:phosphatase PAP2 family protein n=1 Tax=Kitasatospora sp. NPDC047058 TaxID=3155620 RepID=UPI0033C63C55